MIKNKMDLIGSTEVDVCTYCGENKKKRDMITLRIGYRDIILAYSCYPCWNNMNEDCERFGYKFMVKHKNKSTSK